jgi:hypothetical protein
MVKGRTQSRQGESMRSSVTMIPTGCVIWQRDIGLLDPGGPWQFVKELRVWSLTARLQLSRLREPPGADQHAVVVWKLGEKVLRLPDWPILRKYPAGS